MDFFESTKVVFERIEQLEPHNVSEIIGHLLLKDQPELQMIRLAFCPDHALQILIHKVKLELHLSPNNPQMPIPPPFPWPGPIPQMLDFRPPWLPVPVCSSFRQGYCKYGGSCRFLHVFQMQNGDCMVLNPPAASCGSLKQLEMELIELLRSTRGIPVSLSSLPILYFDRFGKVLQETENHSQGRRLSSRMIELLARMAPTAIRLTNRPHRRQSIILDEDMERYARFRVENGRELQVYLTFPPESIFSEQDVHNYFNNFGAVQDVRIPSQVPRMFGFVSFAYPETAALVLTITNPHNICGSQVLVKPYLFKPMLLHRENDEEVHDQEDAESELVPKPRLEDHTDLLGKHQTEGHE